MGRSFGDIAGNYPQYTFIYTDIDTLDISDFKSVTNYILQEKPEIIINCAAYTAVDKAESEQEKALLMNAKVVENLAQIAQKHAIFLVHVSTDYVFDGKGFHPYKEDNPTLPMSVYGKTKLLGEQAIINNLCHCAIVRTSWLYSEYGTNFVKTMLRIGKEREQVSVVSDQIGSPTYASDLAEAIMQIISQKESVKQTQIYHFSNEGTASWYDFAKEIMQLRNCDCEVLPISTESYPTPAQRPLYSVLDKQKVKFHFSLTIPYWRDSLQKCINRLSAIE